ncbi:thiol-disulfide oxidoreductase DCC family protein [Gaoshiqia sp. Z1-71]|uniref:thiol-disulfide oxidoreductase DCC family protein n=1 Tax=Gaoshiqia hydrogeniformans TaxID=3290090 RepID=UPI003BF8708B
MKLPDGKYLVLFDGYCYLCSHTVQVILKFDKKRRFVFAPLTGETAKYWMEKEHIPETVDSVVLISPDAYYIRSAAVLEIARILGGFFLLFRIFRILPQKWLDHLYNRIARNRFRWLGRRDHCLMPSAKYRDRFL